MASRIDQLFDKFMAWLVPFIHPHLPAIRANINRVFGIAWTLIFLFPPLVTSSGLNWWQQPWPHWITLILLWGLALIMTFFAAIYVFFLTPLFLLGLQRGKITFSGSEGVFKKFTTIAIPYLLVVMAVWYDVYLAGWNTRLFSATILILYVLFYVASIFTVLFQVHLRLHRAACLRRRA